MENHPIPQDVTGFQFKLVGNMTIKQFGYVGAGAILAVVLYYAPILWLVKFPLILIFGLSGVGLAFVPIEGRPMDVMISNFIKAVLRPNQYAYHKIGGHLSFTDLEPHSVMQQIVPVPQLVKQQTQSTQEKEAKLREYLYGLSDEPKTAMDERESKFLSMFNQPMGTATPTPVMYPMPQPQPVMPPAPEPVNNQQAQQQAPMPEPEPAREPVAQIMPEQTPAPVMQAAPTPITADQSVQPLTPQQPNEQPQSLQEPVAQQAAQTVVLPEQPLPQAPAVQPVPNAQAVGAPAETGFPNLVSGIIRDSRGNVLAGILIDVKNKDGESVRAFKTNALGQFASATQLSNGSYTIDFEDPKQQHKFESVHVEANGTILPSIVVTSIDAREELRRALFS